MQLKTYQSDQIAALDFAAYSKGDPQAGRRIQAEVDAGTSLASLAHLCEEHRRNLHSPMRQAAKNGSFASPKEIYQAGVSLDTDAKAIMKQKGLPYTQAFKAAVAAAPSTAHVYSHGVKLQAPDVATLKYNAAGVAARYAAGAPGSDTEPTAISHISNLAVGLKLPSGEIDWSRAATAVNNGVDPTIRQQAATESIDELVKRWPNKTRSEIESEHGPLATASLTGIYTAESLKDLLWSLTR
jgi:hypothetical protein